MTSSTRLNCDVIAWASFHARVDQIAGLRRTPGPTPIPASMLRHADEQTVVGLAAVLRAMHLGGLEPGGFDNWAVVAAPQFLGRATFFKSAYPEFLNEGAWGVSPHLISNSSLHSVSGTISLALAAHGPNVGVGGASGSALEALMLAAAMLDEGVVPGVWVVLTAWRPGILGGSSEAENGEYVACAIALGPLSAGRQRVRVRVQSEAVWFEPGGPDEPGTPSLAEWLGLAGAFAERPNDARDSS